MTFESTIHKCLSVFELDLPVKYECHFRPGNPLPEQIIHGSWQMRAAVTRPETMQCELLDRCHTKFQFIWYAHWRGSGRSSSACVNPLRPRQNGRRLADDTLNRIFWNENVRISITISLKFAPKGPINKIPALVQMMAWRRGQATSHYLNQWGLVYRRIYASLGLNQLIVKIGNSNAVLCWCNRYLCLTFMLV